MMLRDIKRAQNVNFCTNSLEMIITSHLVNSYKFYEPIRSTTDHYCPKSISTHHFGLFSKKGVNKCTKTYHCVSTNYLLAFHNYR